MKSHTQKKIAFVSSVLSFIPLSQRREKWSFGDNRFRQRAQRKKGKAKCFHRDSKTPISLTLIEYTDPHKRRTDSHSSWPLTKMELVSRIFHSLGV